MGRHQMKPSLKWMGAFWLSIAGKSSTLIPLDFVFATCQLAGYVVCDVVY